jgi:hypothetical protein
MKPLRISLTVTVLVFFLSLQASAITNDAYIFNIEATKTVDPDTGNTVHLSGAGQFNAIAGEVRGTGSFAVFNASGSELARGVWRATDVVSFLWLGGENRGIQNGILNITVTLYPSGGPAVPNVSMWVVCPPNEGPGEGAKLIVPGGAHFTIPLSGFTNFSIQSGR